MITEQAAWLQNIVIQMPRLALPLEAAAYCHAQLVPDIPCLQAGPQFHGHLLKPLQDRHWVEWSAGLMHGAFGSLPLLQDLSFREQQIVSTRCLHCICLPLARYPFVKLRSRSVPQEGVEASLRDAKHQSESCACTCLFRDSLNSSPAKRVQWLVICWYSSLKVHPSGTLIRWTMPSRLLILRRMLRAVAFPPVSHVEDSICRKLAGETAVEASNKKREYLRSGKVNSDWQRWRQAVIKLLG